jgi:hypothetical protein
MAANATFFALLELFPTMCHVALIELGLNRDSIIKSVHNAIRRNGERYFLWGVPLGTACR